MRTIVTFDSYELTRDYVVSDLRTSLLPRTVSTQDVPGRDGALYTGVRMAPRTITLTLTAVARTPEQRQEAARNLAALLAVDEPRRLWLSIDGGIIHMAVPASIADATRYANATSFEVTFECPDPVAYGQTRTVTVPSGGSVEFVVGGTYPTMPTISASAAGNGINGYWRLLLDDVSHLDATIPAGVGTAPVVADCQARVLRVNGSVTMLDAASDWLALAPGEHELAMHGIGAAIVTYVERWL